MNQSIRSVEKNSKPKWCWISIGIFIVACVAGPLATILQVPGGGDERMAAAINGAIIAGALFLLGFVAAIIGFIKESQHRLLCRLAAFLYFGVPLGLLMFAIFS